MTEERQIEKVAANTAITPPTRNESVVSVVNAGGNYSKLSIIRPGRSRLLEFEIEIILVMVV